MKYIQTFEALVGNKFYFNTEFDIRDLTFKEINRKIRFSKIGTGTNDNIEEMRSLIQVSNKNNYRTYKDNVINYTNNYVWKIDKPLNLFEYTEYNINKLISIAPIFLEYVKHWLSIKSDDPSEIKKIILDKVKLKEYQDFNRLSYYILRFEKEDLLKFKSIWDGIMLNVDNKIEYYIFWDIAKYSKLIGGNELLFGKKSPIKDFELPEWIFDELIRYTNDASKKMNLKVKEWLQENSPKSSDPIRVYRAFSIDLADWSDYSKNSNAIVNDPIKLSKYLYRLTGLKNLTDFIKEHNITIKRGKESSWSHTALIARQFAKGLASASINILVKYEVQPKDIIIDFTLLPEHIKKEFKFRNQNEVILDKGAYQGVIDDIWIDKGFSKWLIENDYIWISKKGIFKN